ncbi:GNAT family N-acetyltransferase [bacterium]|nr:GNAT family N-acetyltransferase [bacterium]
MIRTRAFLTPDDPSSVPALEGKPVTMVRPHLQEIPRPTFSAGFSIRPMRMDEIDVWVAIQKDSEPFRKIVPAVFGEAYGDNAEEITKRCFLIIGPEGEGAGCIGAWFNLDFREGDWGRIHWVATRPAYRRRGLARAGLAYALRRMTEWHTRCYLDTQSKRLGAIRLYLDFGFRPDLEEKGSVETWHEIGRELAHPVLEDLCAGKRPG